MAKLRKLANRTKEFETFLAMAKGQHDCRILLIEGGSGMGKTSLLNRFRRECPPDAHYVPFDCKGVESIAAFLSEVVTELGRDRFPQFTQKVRSFVQGGVDFSENDIAAENTISIAINANVDAKTQEYRLAQLQEAFFADLRGFQQRAVIALDTYQMASDSLKDWIESKWLREVGRRLENVVTIVAGQSIPEPDHSVWCDECEHFSLEPILDVAAWFEFCSEFSKDSSLSEDAVKAIALGCAGHPKNVHQMLSVVVKQWSA